MSKVVIIFFLFVGGCGVIFSQELATPVDLQLNLLPKILLYEKNLKAKNLRVVNVGIVYQRKFRTSLNVKNEVMEYVANNVLKISEFSVLNFIPILIEKESDLSSALAKAEVDVHVLYLCPLKAISIKAITELTQQKKILTYSGVVEYVDEGVAVVIDVKGDKPLITINLPASKLEGADFSSQLLKLARVIQ